MRPTLTAAILALLLAVPTISAQGQTATPKREGKPPVSVIVRAQGTGDPYPALHSLLCTEGQFCTSVFDVVRRRAVPDPAAPASPPVRIEIGVLVRGDGTVLIVPAMPGSKLFLNCLASQSVPLKPMTEATRLRFLVHEEDATCAKAEAGKPAPRPPAPKAVGSIEVVIKTATPAGQAI
jgi:hypothetical protein